MNRHIQNVRKIGLVGILLLTFGAGLLSAAAQAAPLLFYSDLDSGPSGAFVTVWGKDFGSTKGSVLVGAAAVSGANILSWTDSMIEFSVPAIGGNNIVVRDSSGSNSNNISFTTRSTGRIFYISDSLGNDSNNGLAATNQGSGVGPWKTLPRLLDTVKAGDVVYVRAGSYTKIDNTTYKTHLLIRERYAGTPGNPIALVAYPGEKPVIGTLGAGMTSRALYMHLNLTDWTIAKFELKASGTAIGMTQSGDSARIRLIGNTASDINSSYGTIRFRSCTDCKVLGNHVFNSGQAGNKLAHLIYYGGFGSAANVEIAWNLLHDERGGRCIQVYGHTEDDQLSGLSIHDNVVYNCPYDGILVGSSDANKKNWITDAVVYNNLVYNVGSTGIRIHNTGVDARVLHNTVYNGRKGALRVQNAKSIEVKNNIFASTTPTTVLLDYEAADAAVISHNGWSGGTGAPTRDSTPFTGDAAFTDAANGDFSLLPTSPFLDKGVQLTPALPEVSVPADTFPDLGSLAWASHVFTPVVLTVPAQPAQPFITLR